MHLTRKQVEQALEMGTSNPDTTPASEQGIRQFFEGLAALEATLKYSAPGRAAISITPSLAGLIKQFCGSDPRYGRVMANIWIRVEDYDAMKNAR